MADMGAAWHRVEAKAYGAALAAARHAGDPSFVVGHVASSLLAKNANGPMRDRPLICVARDSAKSFL